MEPVEYILEILFANSRPLVLHHDVRISILSRNRQSHFASGGAVADRVIEKVIPDDLEVVWIALNLWRSQRLHVNMYGFGFRHRAPPFGTCFATRGQIHRRHIDSLPRLKLLGSRKT